MAELFVALLIVSLFVAVGLLVQPVVARRRPDWVWGEKR